MKSIAIPALAVLLQAPLPILSAAPPPEAPPTPAPATVNAGLSVSVVAAKAKFTQDEAVRFTVIFKNVSEKTLLLYDIAWPSYAITVDDRWTAGREPGPAIARIAPQPSDSVTLAPGKSINFDFDMANRGYWEKDPRNPTSMINRIEQLPPGKHRLVVERALGMNPAPSIYPHAHWTGAIKHKPAEFEITAAAK